MILVIGSVLILVQVFSFLVFGLAHSELTSDAVSSSQNNKPEFEIEEVKVRLKTMQESIAELTKEADELRQLKGEMQELQRFLDGPVAREVHGENKYVPTTKRNKTAGTEAPVGSELIGKSNIGKIPEAFSKSTSHQKKLEARLNRLRSRYNKYLMFMHIGKSGGTSFDEIGRFIAFNRQYNYIGKEHYDWNRIENQIKQRKGPVDVLVMLRRPIARAFSHFVFYQKQDFSKGMKIRSQSLREYLWDGDIQNLLETRDIWQDGQAGVSWFAGTHIAAWAGCPKEEVDARERRSLNVEENLYLAARRLHEVKWFGLLEDTDKSLIMLQHEFNLTEKLVISHKKKQKDSVTKMGPSPEEKKALALLMPQDLWLYEYARRLFFARWDGFKYNNYTEPDFPPLPFPLTCISTRVELNCTSGPFKGNFRSPILDGEILD